MSDWKAKVDAAYAMVHALYQPRGSQGSREWIMSIPAEPNHDPDLVISAGLRAAEKEIERLQKIEALVRGYLAVKKSWDNTSGALIRLKAALAQGMVHE